MASAAACSVGNPSKGKEIEEAPNSPSKALMTCFRRKGKRREKKGFCRFCKVRGIVSLKEERKQGSSRSLRLRGGGGKGKEHREGVKKILSLFPVFVSKPEKEKGGDFGSYRGGRKEGTRPQRAPLGVLR